MFIQLDYVWVVDFLQSDDFTLDSFLEQLGVDFLFFDAFDGNPDIGTKMSCGVNLGKTAFPDKLLYFVFIHRMFQ